MDELAADAYEAEREHVDTTLDYIVKDELGVRDLMLRLAALEQEAERVATLQAAIWDRYRQRLAGIHDEQERIRRSLEAFVLHVNGGRKVSIPDAGTAYLTTKNKGGKAKVVDAALFEAFAEERRFALYRQTFDAAATLDDAHDEFFYTTPYGKLVDRKTGEVIEIPGVEAVPESKALALRKPS